MIDITPHNNRPVRSLSSMRRGRPGSLWVARRPITRLFTDGARAVVVFCGVALVLALTSCGSAGGGADAANELEEDHPGSPATLPIEGELQLPPADPASPVAGVGAEPTPTLEPRDPPAESEWTAGVVDVRRDVAGAALLTGARTARNEGFDRVVFEFAGGSLPSYHVEYVDRPVRQCGSGDTVPVEGDAWLSVRLEPANAHDEEGRPTVQERTSLPDLPTLLQFTLICDFEAQVEWILGVGSPNRYRVIELREPTRLVVDVMH